MTFEVEIDLDDVFYQVDEDDVVEYLECRGYTIMSKSKTGNQSINTMEDDQIINAICDKFGMAYTSSKIDILNAFKDKVLKM